MKSEELQVLLDKYLTEQASEEEIKLVDEWYQSFETNEGITGQLGENELQKSISAGFASIRAALKF
jgi:hypothetical protein